MKFVMLQDSLGSLFGFDIFLAWNLNSALRTCGQLDIVLNFFSI